ncbi:DUF1992 domain-containing protein [Ornithinimicrobium sp. Y1847]|uniref:DnaJ family domain-containing protein n=1 Tax=Ornithinimicrobium sp. Y1847 TaxID=3405419 RepID=UPI003B67B89E
MSTHQPPPTSPEPWGRPGERPGAAKAQDQLEQQGVVRRRPTPATTARAVTNWVDQQIEQAQRQGAFDDLPGAGKPLRDVDVATDPDWWVKGLIEREQLDLGDAMPGVMQLRREKAGFPGSLVGVVDEAVVRERLADFNERVLADRRRPYGGTGSPPVVGRVDIEEMVASWRHAREELAVRLASEATASSESAAGAVESGVQDAAPHPGEASSDVRPRRRWWQRARG